ncbi:hypothetical protein PAXRUDRAFT_783135 [Paxillus rubicundulus Ve08.2h10]|uniref:Uncharacterized protein n=1 Tax=Paxillus rubicundulus Ve08.2h10 TaxID=930991 RepID=A0A0D0E1Z8_9AGAM|nr:hypothetical protein PAXRUDRAFT_783135 [Paxillus rubicundulus Ve08.2h10]
MEFETVSESSASLSSHKRQRSVMYKEPPDAPPEDLPELPKLFGESILEVFTHRSLQLACHAKYHDNERLSLLGCHTSETIMAQLLFYRRPMLMKSEIETQRKALLLVHIVNTWANFYRLGDELHHDSLFQSSLCEPEQGHLLFLAYLGAIFNEHGFMIVQKWISTLLQLTANVFKDRATFGIGPTDFAEQSGKQPKVEESSQGFSTHSLQHALLSLSTAYKPTHYSLIDYPATFAGPSHGGRWDVSCVVNRIEKGKGMGASKQLAKEQAARAVYYTMGWAPRAFGRF